MGIDAGIIAFEGEIAVECQRAIIGSKNGIVRRCIIHRIIAFDGQVFHLGIDQSAPIRAVSAFGEPVVFHKAQRQCVCRVVIFILSIPVSIIISVMGDISLRTYVERCQLLLAYPHGISHYQFPVRQLRLVVTCNNQVEGICIRINFTNRTVTGYIIPVGRFHHREAVGNGQRILFKADKGICPPRCEQFQLLEAAFHVEAAYLIVKRNSPVAARCQPAGPQGDASQSHDGVVHGEQREVARYGQHATASHHCRNLEVAIV